MFRRHSFGSNPTIWEKFNNFFIKTIVQYVHEYTVCGSAPHTSEAKVRIHHSHHGPGELQDKYFSGDPSLGKKVKKINYNYFWLWYPKIWDFLVQSKPVTGRVKEWYWVWIPQCACIQTKQSERTKRKLEKHFYMHIHSAKKHHNYLGICPPLSAVLHIYTSIQYSESDR